MKRRIISWGKGPEDKKYFFTFDLQVKENRVDGHIIAAENLTQEFENLVANQWREGKDLQFPEETQSYSSALTVTEPILPTGFELDSPNLLKRAQSEWNFLVMSQKLSDLYDQEAQDLKEKIENLTQFESPVWESLKGFWTKVNDQILEKNLLRNHGNQLREHTNLLFEKMKELRKKMDTEFREKSDHHKAKIVESLDQIEKKIEEGLSLQPLFNQLKKVQADLKNEDLTKGHRRKLWDRIDKAFKAVKAKRYGGQPETKDGGKSRLEHRLDGLLGVIQRMERSIQRDRNDLEFQNKRINTTSGQLEAEIRKAKIQMIDSRITSKQEKLDDMINTKMDLEQRLQKEKVREKARVEKKEHEEKLKQAQKEAKEKIASQVTEKKDLKQEELDKLLTAAEAINESRQARKKKVGQQQAPKSETEDKKEGDQELTITEFVSDQLEDIVDTARAVASILGDKIENLVSDLTENKDSEE